MSLKRDMLVPSRIHISKKENQKITSTPSKTYNQLEIHKPINQLTPRPPESRPCTTPPRCLCRRPRCQRSGLSPALPPSAGFAESGGSPIPRRRRGSAPGGVDGKPDLHRPRNYLRGGFRRGGEYIFYQKFSIGSTFLGGLVCFGTFIHGFFLQALYLS